MRIPLVLIAALALAGCAADEQAASTPAPVPPGAPPQSMCPPTVPGTFTIPCGETRTPSPGPI